MPAVPEFELKYEIPTGREAVVACVLSQLCTRDPDYPESFVSSVYFDTRDFQSLQEKTNSDYLKTKVRLRWYEIDGAPQGDRAFIEVKQKIGSRRTKRRLTASLPASGILNEPLDSSAFDDLEGALRSAGILTHGPLRPVLTIRYRRHRYYERASGCRVSLDTGISVPRFNRHIVSQTGSTRPHTAIVELKSSEQEIPPSLRILVDLGCRKTSVSKYALCLERLRPIHH